MNIYLTNQEINLLISQHRFQYHKIIKRDHLSFYNHVLNSHHGKTFSEKLYNYLNPDITRMCKHCSAKETTFLEITTGYRPYCSRQCLNNSEYMKERRRLFDADYEKVAASRQKYKETSLRKYGFGNPNSHPSVREKRRNTSLKKYGHVNPAQSIEVQTKMRNTMLERYGVENNFLLSLKNRKSKKATLWLDSINPHMIREYYCKELRMVFDGFDTKTNTVYEFHGDYWHGHPAKYLPENINPHLNKSFGELYEATKEREQKILDHGFNLVVMWEHEFDK